MNGPSKISNLHISSGGNQNVFRFDVSVDDLTIMASLKCTGDLIYVFGTPGNNIVKLLKIILVHKLTLAPQIFRVFGPAVLGRVLPLQHTQAPRKLACHQQNTSAFGEHFHALNKRF